MGIRINNSQPSAMSLVETKAFASNAVTFSGLSGSGYYVLQLSMTCVDATQAALEINTDATITDYYVQFYEVNHAAVAADRYNDNYSSNLPEGGDYSQKIEIARCPSGYVEWRAHRTGPHAADTVRVEFIYGTKTTGTVTEITSIKVVKKALGTSLTGTASLYKISV